MSNFIFLLLFFEVNLSYDFTISSLAISPLLKLARKVRTFCFHQFHHCPSFIIKIDSIKIKRLRSYQIKKMGSLTRLKKYLQTFGLFQSDSSDKFVSTSINYLVFVTLVQHVAAVIWFIANDAQTFREYVESFYYICYALQVLAWYTIHFLNRNKYNRYFAELDEIIACS